MVSESAVCKILEPYLVSEYGRFSKEVPFFSKRIDYICLDKERDEIVAIEAKVRDWKRGLSQALLYRICADKVYLALWHDYLHRVPFEIFKKYGIGILSVDGWTEEIVEPSSLGLVQKSQLWDIKKRVCESIGVHEIG